MVQAGGGQAGGQVRAGAGEDGVAGPGAQHPHCEYSGEGRGRQEEQQEQPERRPGRGRVPGEARRGWGPAREGAGQEVGKPARGAADTHCRLL